MRAGDMCRTGFTYFYGERAVSYGVYPHQKLVRWRDPRSKATELHASILVDEREGYARQQSVPVTVGILTFANTDPQLSLVRG